MSDNSPNQPPWPLELTPFQSDLISQVLDNARSRRIVVTAPPGTGKSTGVVALMAALRQRKGTALRALVLSPRFVLPQWQMRISKFAIGSVEVVDAQHYRYLQVEAESGHNPWDRNGIFLTTSEFLSRDDRTEEILRTAWDLVVIDELHQYRNPDSQRGRLAQRLWEDSKVQAAVGLASVDLLPPFALENGETERVNWTLTDIESRLQGSVTPARKIEVHEYRLSKAEADLVELVLSRLEGHQPASGVERLYRTLLVSQMQSSLNATEPMLRRAAQRSEWEDHDASKIWEAELADAEDPLTEDLDAAAVEAGRPNALPFSSTEYERLFHLLEESGDSKWQACERVLLDLMEPNDLPAVLLFSQSAATAAYLQVMVGLLEIPCHCITGAVPSGLRAEAVADQRANGGVMILTEAAATGFDLGFVDHAIHYDLPRDRVRFLQRAGRIERWGRAGETVYHHFFIDGLLVARQEIEELLRESFG